MPMNRAIYPKDWAESPKRSGDASDGVASTARGDVSVLGAVHRRSTRTDGGHLDHNPPNPFPRLMVLCPAPVI